MTMSSTRIFSIMMWIEAGCLLVALIAIKLSGVEVSLLGIVPVRSVIWGFIGAMICFAAVVVLARSPTSLGHTLRGHCSQLTSLFSGISTAQIVLLSIAAGVCEEFLFRGFLQTWLSQLSSPLLGLLGASLIFGLLHWASFTYFLMTMVVGLVLGIAYQKTGSLLGVMVWHAIYDVLALTVIVYYPRLLDPDVPMIK
ncbi:CPBP family intramembrane glutamic endopeptidase [Microbulbifer epialgicus]|uniref:Lysostaphin resistance A-like protein n=1 Tax=Microbulbifer epialgicus TaxID=393907 RepID=A0ABV4P782_9GAMM